MNVENIINREKERKNKEKNIDKKKERKYYV